MGERIVAEAERGALRQQGQDQIAKAIGMAEGDGGQMTILWAQIHGLTDLVAVGEQFMVGEKQGLGSAGAAGGELDHTCRGVASGCGEEAAAALVADSGGAQLLDQLFDGGLRQVGIQWDGDGTELLAGKKQRQPIRSIGKLEQNGSVPQGSGVPQCGDKGSGAMGDVIKGHRRGTCLHDRGLHGAAVEYPAPLLVELPAHVWEMGFSGTKTEN